MLWRNQIDLINKKRKTINTKNDVLLKNLEYVKNFYTENNNFIDAEINDVFKKVLEEYKGKRRDKHIRINNEILEMWQSFCSNFKITQGDMAALAFIEFMEKYK